MAINKVKSKKAKNGFTYRVRFDYKDIHTGVKKTYSKSGFITKKEAQDHESYMKNHIMENGELKKNTEKNFGLVYKEFLEFDSDNYQHNTMQNTIRVFNSWLSKPIGKNKIILSEILITRLNYQFLQSYFNELSNNGIETNKSIKKAINRVLNYAIKVNYIQNNPLNLVKVKGIEKSKDTDEYLTYNNFIRIVETLEKTNNFRQHAYSMIIKIGYYTGLRISEINALHKKDIDFDNNLIYVNSKLNYKGLKKNKLFITHEMKSKKSKAYIPLCDVLKQELINWFKMNPFDKVICDENDYYISPDIAGNQIRKITNKLGIKFHFHMLRHTYSTNLYLSGVDVKTSQELLRHSNYNTTMSIYTHVDIEKQLNAINSVFPTKISIN